MNIDNSKDIKEEPKRNNIITKDESLKSGGVVSSRQDSKKKVKLHYRELLWLGSNS